VVLPDALRAVLAGGAVHERILEVAHDELVYAVAEVLHCALAALQHHWVLEVRQLALGLRVHPAQPEMVSGSDTVLHGWAIYPPSGICRSNPGIFIDSSTKSCVQLSIDRAQWPKTVLCAVLFV
jgi:hypothetical protein